MIVHTFWLRADAALMASDDVSEPFPVPYPSMLGKAEALRAWKVPANLLREGRNALELTLTVGAPTNIVFIDLATITA